MSDGSHFRTPRVQVVLQEDVMIEWVTGIVQTWGEMYKVKQIIKQFGLLRLKRERDRVLSMRTTDLTD